MSNVISAEGTCQDCGETVVNAQPGDPHFTRADGTDCGGTVTPTGAWTTDLDLDRDTAEEDYLRRFCDPCGSSPCTWDGRPDGFHTDEVSAR